MLFEEKLGDGLVLRTVRSESDIERYVVFNTTYNNVHEGQTCDCLLRHHPETSWSDYWLIENEGSGEIVSTTCLIPWMCHYEGINLKVAMLEMVLTQPAYRGQGLVRAQINRFSQEVQARNFDLSVIWGIPYYYRQFGYGYCLDGHVFESLPVARIPEAATCAQSAYRLRSALLDDLPRLGELYRASLTSLQLCVLRNPQYWEYLMRWARYPVEILEDVQSGEIAGYAVISRGLGDQSIRILESGISRGEVGLALLRLLKVETGKEILVAWSETSTLAQLARSLGSQTVPGGQWLLRIPDVARFLVKIGPVLENRLAVSAWRGLTIDFTLNLFRQAFRLGFVDGKLVRVEPLGFVDTSMGADGGHLCIPPEAFLRLVYGYRGLAELRDAWPDIMIKPEVRHLVEVLFPGMLSYLHMPFHAS